MGAVRLVLVPLLLALVACGGGGGAGGEARIRGTVVAGPQCPVVQEGSPCPDRPVPDAQVVVSTAQGERVTTVRSGPDGRFEVSVAPGRYVLTVEGLQGIQFAKPVEVTVRAGEAAEATVLLDTGIR